MARGGGDGSNSRKGGRGDEEAQEQGGAKVGWADNVDRLLDASPGFVSALRAAFIRYQDPKTAAIPPTSLLPALQIFFQRAIEDLDPRAGKLLFRPVTGDDLDALAEEDLDLGIGRPADIDKFGAIAKKVTKRVLVDRGKRLGLFVIGGVVVVHAIKGIAKHLPFLGPVVGRFPELSADNASWAGCWCGWSLVYFDVEQQTIVPKIIRCICMIIFLLIWMMPMPNALYIKQAIYRLQYFTA